MLQGRVEAPHSEGCDAAIREANRYLLTIWA